MSENVVNFPSKTSAVNLDLGQMVEANDETHHVEILHYEDDSYVVLVQPKSQEFTLERMVFMAERLKLDLFDALPTYEDTDPEPTG